MDKIGITVLGFIIFLIVVAIIKGLGKGVDKVVARKRYDKAIETSTGLEKIRLMIRADFPTISLQFKKDEEKSNWVFVTLAVDKIHMDLADTFYPSLEEILESLNKSTAFDELSEEVSSNGAKELTLASRLFGIAFGIEIAKAANESGKKIKKASVKKYIDSCKLDEKYRKELSKMTMSLIDFIKDKTPGALIVSEDLGAMAYALTDGVIDDPIIQKPMVLAITYAYREASIGNSVIKELEKEGLIG